MIASVLGAKYRTLITPENFNNDIGTPLTLLGLGPEHQAAVIETGMNHFGEIRYLGEMVRPDIAVISNIGDAHIEYLGSREGILKAKSEIFDHLKPDGIAVLNGDDALIADLLHRLSDELADLCVARGDGSDLLDRGGTLNGLRKLLQALYCRVRSL